MTKKLLIVPFVLAIFMFASCDTGITYPEATVAEVETAYVESYSVIYTKSNEAYNDLGDQISSNSTSTSFAETIELDNESLTSELYSSISGEITWNFDSSGMEMILDLTLSGSGPVVTFYAKSSYDSGIHTYSNILVNGHDMTDDLKDLL